MPAIAFLAVNAHDTIFFLYGAKWASVVPLLPLAAAASGTLGIWNALSGLLLANEDSRAALFLDVLAALTAIGLAFLLVPHGAQIYLAGVALHALAFVGITVAVLLQRRAISAQGVAMAIVPAAIAGLAGAAAVLGLHTSSGWISGFSCGSCVTGRPSRSSTS